MNLLVCSYYFGVGAEGICTERLVRALLEKNISITVITSNASRPSIEAPHLEVIVVPSGPVRPTPLFRFMARMTGQVPSTFFIWSVRAAYARPKRRPDLVYGRAQPISSQIVASKIAKRYRAPLWQHFSDPFPSPWSKPDSLEFSRELSDVKKLIAHAEKLTFTTDDGLRFQNRLIGDDAHRKAFVLPHVAPPAFTLRKTHRGPGRTFVYLGSFYKERRSNELLKGFAAYWARNPLAKLYFVGSTSSELLADIRDTGLGGCVHTLGRTTDIQPYMEMADVLVAVDSFVGEPVFLTTKLVEYLMTDRLVLLISPTHSPSARLVEGMRNSVVHVSEHSAAAIASGLERASTIHASNDAIATRMNRMKEFSGKAISSIFVNEMEASLRCFESQEGNKTAETLR